MSTGRISESLTFLIDGVDNNNFLGNNAVGFTVHLVRCLCVWCMDKTENLAATFVKPIFTVLHAVFSLHFDIGLMSFRNIFRGGSVKLVNVHVQRHSDEV